MMDKLLIDFKVPWKGLRHIFLGGSPVPKILVEKALMKYWPINVVYGSTETASMITVCSMKNLEQHGVSAGIPLEGVKLRIEKQSNRLLTYGRIVIESKSVAVSYFNVNNKIEKDLGGGIYRSMDLGRIDKNGNLYISGRMDDIIISGGENISLPEIDNLLNENKELANCKTIGINDNKWGQSYIIITDNEKKDIAKKIKDFLTERVAKFKLPHEVVIVDKIPVNELGKLNKNELKKTLKFDFL